MKKLMIALRFLKKQFVLNLLILVEVLVSIMILTELFVYISDRIDNQRAVEELQNDALYVLSEFEYYQDEEDAIISMMKEDPGIDKVGTAEILGCALDSQPFSLGAYNSDLTMIYTPKLVDGVWLSTDQNAVDPCPAVVSADMGLRVGNTATITVENSGTLDIQVIGVLATPTQYLLPSGMSSEVDSFIEQSSVILINRDQVAGTLPNDQSGESTIRTLFLLSDRTEDQLISKYGQYGRIQAINQMIRNYQNSSSELIASEGLLFGLFFLLASIVILSSEVIHNLSCRRDYAIYYLTGMKWEQCVGIEVLRHVILMVVILGATALMDRYGLLRTEWLTGSRHVWLYGTVVVYLSVIFFGTGAAFIRNLLHHDISESLRNLNGGE